MTSTSITLEGCSRTFPGGQVALHPLNLTVAAGETLVLLGPSGCGKTTTLRIISGLESPDAGGRVIYGDRDVTALPIEKRDVGMVFQSYALFPNMSVAENIAYGLRIKGMSRDAIQQRLNEVMAMVDLQGFGMRRIHELSGGQKQRVALARAIAVRPRVLLFDEPLAALDAKLRDRLRLDIGQLLRELGITAVYVTHDQAEAMALGDRIAVMQEGRIAQLATPREIYHRPASSFVADFIGAVNCLKVRATLDNRRIQVSGGEICAPHLTGVTSLYCRPEDIQIAEEGNADLRGRVIQSIFLGQNQRLVIDVGDDSYLQVDTASRRQWHTGEPICLRLASEVLFHPDRHSPGTQAQEANYA